MIELIGMQCETEVAQWKSPISLSELKDEVMGDPERHRDELKARCPPAGVRCDSWLVQRGLGNRLSPSERSGHGGG